MPKDKAGSKRKASTSDVPPSTDVNARKADQTAPTPLEISNTEDQSTSAVDDTSERPTKRSRHTPDDSEEDEENNDGGPTESGPEHAGAQKKSSTKKRKALAAEIEVD